MPAYVCMQSLYTSKLLLEYSEIGPGSKLGDTMGGREGIKPQGQIQGGEIILGIMFYKLHACV